MSVHLQRKQESALFRSLSIVIYAVYAYFCWRLVDIAMQYLPYRTDVAFLRIKQDVSVLLHYRIAFFTHVYSTLFVLPAGFFQFSKGFRIRYPAMHRAMGWLYVTVVLVFAAPSGCWMGLFANGGWTSQVSFCLLAILWFYFTFRAVRFASQGKFLQHRKEMIRSFALTLSAITLRLWKPVLVYLFHPHPMDVYRLVSWLGWGINLLLAEFIILKLKSNYEKNNFDSSDGTSVAGLSGQ